MNCKKRELEVLVEEEAKLGNDIKKSQKEIEILMKGLSDVEVLLGEVSTVFPSYQLHLQSMHISLNWQDEIDRKSFILSPTPM